MHAWVLKLEKVKGFIAKAMQWQLRTWRCMWKDWTQLPVLNLPFSLSSCGQQGWRSGESTCLPPMSPGFKSRHRRHIWVEFVVVALLSSERFFSGTPVSPLSSKTNISRLQFNQESGRWRTTMWMCYLQRRYLNRNLLYHILVIYYFIV